MTMTPSPQTKPYRLFPCRRHPSEPVTGICPSCLRERLAVFDSSGHPEPSYSTTGAASESIIPRTSADLGGVANATSGGSGTSAVASSSIRSELRRCRSYSSCKTGAYPGVAEPRGKSCDVRVRNSLWHHFSLTRGTELDSKNRGFSGVTDCENRHKVRVSEDTSGQNTSFNEPCVEEKLKTMKEHIELECHSRRRKHTARDLKDIAGSFWLAASVFSQKLRKFRLKQRMKKRHGGGGGNNLSPAEKINGRQLTETQSEVGYYGHGRRSCDTDPRFSIDAGRMSLDDPRFSIDEPRASWDGCMTVKPIPQLPAMLSVIENVTVLPINRPEDGMSVEEQMNSINGENETTTCGSTPAQSRDYCSDSSSSQRQNSCDCSSPTATDALHRMNSVVRYRDTRSSDFNSHKYDDNPDEFKKSRAWQKVWKFLGFMQRLTDAKQEDVEGGDIGLIGDCGLKQNGVLNYEASSGKLVRSGSCVSSRLGSYSPSLSRVAEIRGYAKKSGREFALERNWSARYSPNNFENGLLRFHLTPSWSCRRKSGRRRRRSRSVLRMNWS